MIHTISLKNTSIPKHLNINNSGKFALILFNQFIKIDRIILFLHLEISLHLILFHKSGNFLQTYQECRNKSFFGRNMLFHTSEEWSMLALFAILRLLLRMLIIIANDFTGKYFQSFHHMIFIIPEEWCMMKHAVVRKTYKLSEPSCLRLWAFPANFWSLNT